MRDIRRTSLIISGLVVSTALASACDEPEVPETPVPDAGPTTTTQAPTTTTTTTTTTTAASGPCDATMQLALQTAIKGREAAEVSAGMKPESTFNCQVVQAGGTMSVPVNLLQGKCYTFLAHSFPNVTDIDLFLKPNFGPTPPPLLAPFANTVVAQDSEQGPTASIGKGQNCFKNPFPIPGPVIAEVTAKQGEGPIAIQVYVK